MHLLPSLVALASIASVTTAYKYHPSKHSIIAHEGTPVGKESVHNGVNLYISKPHGKKASDTAVLYLTDVFGIQLAQNKLLADSFARANFLTITPDLFDGSPAPNDINQPGFNTTTFLAAHTPNVTDPIIASTIAYIKDELKVKKIAVTGYCFGGRYAFRFLAEGKGADVGFAAHPSLLTDDEIVAIDGPVSIAAAETDNMLTQPRLAQIQGLLKNTTLPYSIAQYSGTSHGFAVRANISDPEQKFGKEEAFFQAVRFFQAWA